MEILFDVSDVDHPILRHELRANFRDRGVLAFSPDSRWLAAGSQNAAAQIWNLTAADIPASVRTAPFIAASVCGVSFSHSGKYSTDSEWLALGDSDGRLHLWDWQHGSTAIRHIEVNDSILSAAFLPDGRIAEAGGDTRVRIWETDPNKLIELARTTAGRDLTPQEKARVVRQR